MCFLMYFIYGLLKYAVSKFVDQLVTNSYIIWIEYIEITIMDWSDEYKLCYIGHCKQNITLWDTRYID
jgi:hypothetical protein